MSDGNVSFGVTPAGAVTQPRSSQPAGSPLAKHSEHTVKCVLPVSKVTTQGKGAGGGGKGVGLLD